MRKTGAASLSSEARLAGVNHVQYTASKGTHKSYYVIWRLRPMGSTNVRSILEARVRIQTLPRKLRWDAHSSTLLS